jgi:hypothetical protein
MRFSVCIPLKDNRRFGGQLPRYFKGWRISKLETSTNCLIWTSCWLFFFLAYSSTLKMEVTRSSETLADPQRTARRYIPEYRTLQIHYPVLITYMKYCVGERIVTLLDPVQSLGQSTCLGAGCLLKRFLYYSSSSTRIWEAPSQIKGPSPCMISTVQVLWSGSQHATGFRQFSHLNADMLRVRQPESNFWQG